MRCYTLGQVARLFDIHPSTLFRWLRRSAIESCIDPVNYRCRMLSRPMIARLAEEHRRVVVLPGDDDLGSRVAVLEAMIKKACP